MEAINFKKGAKPHSAVVKHAKEYGADAVDHVHHKDGHSVQSHGGDEYEAYHHVDDKGKHQGHYMYDHETRGGAEAPSKREIKKALPNSPDHVHTAIHNHIKTSIGEEYQMDTQDYYARYISNQMKSYVYENEELVHGMSHEGGSIHLNRSKTDRDRNDRSHYVIKNKEGQSKTFSVHNSKAGDDTNGHKHIATQAGLSSNHPFVKTIHKSHTGGHGPAAWQD